MVASLVPWGVKRGGPFKSRVRIGLESLRYRESLFADYNPQRDLLSICKDMSAVRRWRVGTRLPSPIDLRHGIVRAQRYLRTAEASGLEDIPGKCSELATGGTSLLLMPAKPVLLGHRLERSRWSR